MRYLQLSVTISFSSQDRYKIKSRKGTNLNIKPGDLEIWLLESSLRGGGHHDELAHKWISTSIQVVKASIQALLGIHCMEHYRTAPK